MNLKICLRKVDFSIYIKILPTENLLPFYFVFPLEWKHSFTIRGPEVYTVQQRIPNKFICQFRTPTLPKPALYNQEFLFCKKKPGPQFANKNSKCVPYLGQISPFIPPVIEFTPYMNAEINEIAPIVLTLCTV